MNEYKFKWDMTEKQFDKLKIAIRNLKDSDGCYGNIYIGNYCIDITLCSDYINLDFYHIGIDSGYGYTKRKQTPYDFEDGINVGIKPTNILELSFNNFKLKLEQMIIKEFNSDIKRFCDKQFLEKEVFCELADWS